MALVPLTVPAVSSLVSVPWVPVCAVPPLMVRLVLAVRVVNTAVLGVVVPMAQGIAQVQPFRRAAFKLLTWVVEAMTKGAVPVVTVEVSCPLRASVVTLIPLLNTGVPLKVGLPLQVPLRLPPPPRTLGPLLVKPTLKMALPLKIVEALKVLVPVQVLFDARRERLLAVMLSIDQNCVPPPVLSTNL